LSIQNKLSLKEQVQRFPRSNISDTADRLRYKAGLPTLNSFSSSSEEEKFKKLRTSTENFPRETVQLAINISEQVHLETLKDLKRRKKENLLEISKTDIFISDLKKVIYVFELNNDL
jgi:hypothetical protein